MTELLYPILFEPSYHYRIWGGNRLSQYGKNITEKNIGESWEISTIPGYVSIVANGHLKSRTLLQILQTYKSRLVGEKVYKKYGDDFPLLIKFLDSSEPLSVQVHPDDKYAYRQGYPMGKSEMWYILESEEKSEIILGFEKNVSRQLISESIEKGNLERYLHKIHPEKGDVFYIPAGTVHGIGKGITLLEIQQTSDITYRLYDYNRIDADGSSRELHLPQAMEVMSLSGAEESIIPYNRQVVEPQLLKIPYFTVSKWTLTESKSVENIGTFRIFICIDGKGGIESDSGTVEISLGQTVLIPAGLKEVVIDPENTITLLEVHIDL